MSACTYLALKLHMAALQLETACLDCVRYDPNDPLARALAIISSVPYLTIFFQAAVSGHAWCMDLVIPCLPMVRGPSAGPFRRKETTQEMVTCLTGGVQQA